MLSSVFFSNLLQVFIIQYIILCMQSEPDSYFCFLNINTHTDFLIRIVEISLSTLLVVYALYKYLQMRHTRNSSTGYVYTFLFIWWITFISANCYAIILYLLYHNDPDNHSTTQMSQLSKYYFMVDWVNAFTIQLLLLYVPYHWSKNICLLFNAPPDRNRESQPFHEYHGPETRIYPFLKNYIRFRILWLALPVAFLLLNDPTIVFKTQICCLLIDCAVITGSLLLGMCSLKNTKQLLQSLDQAESSRMFNQYLIIIFANLIRFGFDILFVISSVFRNDTFTARCPTVSPEQPVVSIALQIAVCVLAHFFPILIIIRIYTLEEQPEQICKSLIYNSSSQATENG